MVSMKILLLAIAVTVISVGLGQVGTGPQLSGYIAGVIGITASCVGSTSIVVLERRRFGFHAFVKDQSVEPSQVPELLGIKSLKIKSDHVCVEGENGRLVVHAYIRIRDIPFLIDDLDQSKKLLLVGNFVRLL